MVPYIKAYQTELTNAKVIKGRHIKDLKKKEIQNNNIDFFPRVANPSIGELSLGASLSMGSGSHLDRYDCIVAAAFS